MDFLLFIIASLLKIALTPILLLYGLIRSIFLKQTEAWFKDMAIATDILGNAMGKYIFNDLLKKKGGYSFGVRNDTISCAMGYNQQDGTLSGFGKFIGWILNSLDKDHLKKSIENK